MLVYKKILALVGLVTALGTASSMTIGSPTSFNGLTWNISSNVPGATGCNRLILDATGDLSRGSALALNGFVNCGSGSFAVVGAGYFDIYGRLNMTLHIGAGVIVACNGLTAFSGSCTGFNGNGNVIGSAAVTFL